MYMFNYSFFRAVWSETIEFNDNNKCYFIFHTEKSNMISLLQNILIEIFCNGNRVVYTKLVL